MTKLFTFRFIVVIAALVAVVLAWSDRKSAQFTRSLDVRSAGALATSTFPSNSQAQISSVPVTTVLYRAPGAISTTPLASRRSVRVPDDPQSIPQFVETLEPLGNGIAFVNNQSLAIVGKDGHLTHIASPIGAGHLLVVKPLEKGNIVSIYWSRSYTFSVFALNLNSLKWTLLGEFLTEINDHQNVSMAVNKNRMVVMNGWAHAGVNEGFANLSDDGGRTWRTASVPTYGSVAFSGSKLVIVASNESGRTGWYTSDDGVQWTMQPNPSGEGDSLFLDPSSSEGELAIYGKQDVMSFDETQNLIERVPKWVDGKNRPLGRGKRVGQTNNLPFDPTLISDGYLRADGTGLLVNRKSRQAALTETGGGSWTVVSLSQLDVPTSEQLVPTSAP